jgi:hypothetical protein
MLSTDVSHLTVPEKTAAALRELTGETRPDVALLLVIRNAAAYELEQIGAGMRVFEAKYQMTFEEYRRRWEREDRTEDYQWEAERDYLEWEALAIRQVRLSDIYGWLI